MSTYLFSVTLNTSGVSLFRLLHLTFEKNMLAMQYQQDVTEFSERFILHHTDKNTVLSLKNSIAIFKNFMWH